MMMENRRENAHVFRSYNESWELPEAWHVSPTSPGWGLGSCSWLFKNREKTIVVSNLNVMSFEDQCIYPPIGIPKTPVDLFAVFGNTATNQAIDIEWIKSYVLTEPSPLIIAMDSVADCAAAVVDVAHSSAHLNKPVVIYGKKLFNDLMLLATMYEWVNEDMQVYLRKCVKYATMEGTIDYPLVLLDLVRSNRVLFTVDRDMKETEISAVFCSANDMYLSSHLAMVDGSRLKKGATITQVVEYFKPRQVLSHSSAQKVWETESKECVTNGVRSEEDLVRVLKIRYDEVHFNSTAHMLRVDVKSVGIRAIFMGTNPARILDTVDVYLADVSDTTLAQFIHLVT
jgi:hypothetical protein